MTEEEVLKRASYFIEAVSLLSKKILEKRNGLCNLCGRNTSVVKWSVLNKSEFNGYEFYMCTQCVNSAHKMCASIARPFIIDQGRPVEIKNTWDGARFFANCLKRRI